MLGQSQQLLAEGARRSAPHSRVDLVEHERRTRRAVARREPHGEGDARELAAGCGARDRRGGEAGVRLQEQLDVVGAARPRLAVGDAGPRAARAPCRGRRGAPRPTRANGSAAAARSSRSADTAASSSASATSASRRSLASSSSAAPTDSRAVRASSARAASSSASTAPWRRAASASRPSRASTWSSRPGSRLELLQVAAQLDARLPQARDRLLQIGERRREARVELDRALELVRRVARQRQGARSLLGVHALGSIRRGRDEPVEVTQAVALDAQRRLLARLQRRARPRPRRAPATPPARARARRAARASASQRAVRPRPVRRSSRPSRARRSPASAAPSSRSSCTPGRASRRDSCCETISRRPPPSSLEIGTRARAPEDERTRAAVRTHAPGEQQLVLVVGHEAGDAVGHELGRHLGECRLDVGLAAGGPDERGVGLAAEQQRDRLGDDRLAGARLARQHVQARRELERRLADQDEVRDAQLAQHQRPNVSRKRCRNDTPGSSARRTRSSARGPTRCARPAPSACRCDLSVEDQARVDVDARVLDHDAVAAAEHERAGGERVRRDEGDAEALEAPVHHGAAGRQAVRGRARRRRDDDTVAADLAERHVVDPPVARGPCVRAARSSRRRR